MKIGTTRVETFSDGVIAIIITIMAIELKLPEFDQENTGITIQNQLKELLPHFITYSFSFLMIGIFWTNHHHMYHLLEKTDEALLVQNLFFLFFISLIPLATAFLGASPLVPEAVAFYGLIMLLTTVAFAIMRSYAIRRELFVHAEETETTRAVYRVSIRGRRKSIYGAIAYLASLPLAFVSVYLAFACFVIPPILFFIPDGIDDERLAEKIAEKTN